MDFFKWWAGRPPRHAGRVCSPTRGARLNVGRLNASRGGMGHLVEYEMLSAGVLVWWFGRMNSGTG